jgi:nucleoside-diphosphate-sugar epimerase
MTGSGRRRSGSSDRLLAHEGVSGSRIAAPHGEDDPEAEGGVKRILVTGALGQIGTELVVALRARPGVEEVVSTNIRIHDRGEASETDFEILDVRDAERLRGLVEGHRVDTLYHLASVLSARAETDPQRAWEINMDGLMNVLEVAREAGCALFFPSSIAAFGPSTPSVATPQTTIQRPTSIYGVTKVAGELLCDYYHARYGVDTRGVRYPGLISYAAPPGGGTTDYAVEIFHAALRDGRYVCFLGPRTRLDMMYMPDALDAAIDLMEAEPARLEHRNAYNVTGMSFTPEELAAEIRRHLPAFEIAYEVDPVRQAIADSWPDSLDDSAARSEWDWNPRFDLAAMTADMLEKLEAKLSVSS